MFKKICFKCRLKMSIELLDLSSSGIEFHSFGAATANALSPYVITHTHSSSLFLIEYRWFAGVHHLTLF